MNESLSDNRFFTVTRISDGVAFGDGLISGAAEDPQVLAIMDELIHNSPDIIQPVDSGDDGCSDGRPAVVAYSKQGEIKAGLYRPKVFGGSVAMTAASLVGLGLASGKSLQLIFDEAIAMLVRQGMNFGAHTDSHATGVNCGCGAIDKAPEALIAALKYEDDIRGAIAVLGIDSIGLDQVFDNFRNYVESDAAQPGEYGGKQVIDQIVMADKIIKKLDGPHFEKRIVLNSARDYTVNQRRVREATEGEGQVFAVDVWRLQDICQGLFPQHPDRQHQAFLSQLVYTFGTAAVLTKGDLPIDMIELSTRV